MFNLFINKYLVTADHVDVNKHQILITGKYLSKLYI
jgi:hypothetical protein